MPKLLSLDETQPNRRPGLDNFQPIPIIRGGTLHEMEIRRRRGCLTWTIIFGVVLAYFLTPFRTNILILGTDDSPDRGALGRTDTIILTSVVPLKPYLGMLGIPRDLWVQVPEVGEQRINTAYFFAESVKPGNGALAVEETIHHNFGVSVDHYLLLHMLDLVDMIDKLGGIDIMLDEPLAGLSAGTHHLDGSQVLSMARERNSADDFSRMKQGQIILLAILKKSINPLNWPRLPGVSLAASRVIQTDIPAWLWPRLGFALLRAPLFGIDNRIISSDMVTPYVTGGGAQVLIPDWDAINPVLHEIFGEQ